MASTGNALNLSSSTPLSPLLGGTGIDNGVNTLTVGANSTVNQNVGTLGTPSFKGVSLYPVGSNNNALNVNAVFNSTGSFSCTLQNVGAFGQAQTVVIPDVGASSADFIMSSTAGSGQFVNSGYFQVNSGNIYIGNGGGAHSLICYPAGASAGYLAVNATNNATGNFTTTLTNATAVAQNQTITIPDCGASTGKVLLTSTPTPQTIAANKYLTFDVGAQTGTGGGGAWNFTLTNQCGVITTGTDTLGAGGTMSFTITNANITVNSVVLANPGNNLGADSFACTVSVGAGAIGIQMLNTSGTPYTQAFQVMYMIAAL